jgi:hypothetical protein
MSIFRHLLASTCVPALVLSCATRHEFARVQPALLNDRHSFMGELELRSATRTAEPSAANAYTPTRLRNAEAYSWQSENRAICLPDAPAQKGELEVRARRGLLAALPERASELSSQAQPISPDFVVAKLRPAFHHCFAQWLDERVDAQGSVRFALELGCAGAVEAISAENQGVDENTLECLFSAVAPARFAPPAGGHATILVPVVFRNAAR